MTAYVMPPCRFSISCNDLGMLIVFLIIPIALVIGEIAKAVTHFFIARPQVKQII